ncbi:MAG: DUF3784 domain-containing protein [Clostridium sp.]|uniref:DUF3784 domain-containing protein n=1 Tax=Clostridium sp. TaxID=1506 RepID=UPI0025C6BB4E|nr:DUF3784 domain-containing protein [Clostridium sp.]MCE5221908.1 DUF3784 domain-containing protein [Clostridium sp.]
MKEYSWTIVGLVISGFFGLLGMIFLIFKEKACVLISGYNLKTKKEREEYDEVCLSKDERNFFFRCAIIFLIGAVISIFIGSLSFWIAFVVWLVYFFKNLHFNDEKAFAKYKRKI